MSQKPHIIVIIADQLRYEMLASQKPHINQLMAESTNFTRAYCASPLCVPARRCVLHWALSQCDWLSHQPMGDTRAYIR